MTRFLRLILHPAAGMRRFRRRVIPMRNISFRERSVNRAERWSSISDTPFANGDDGSRLVGHYQTKYARNSCDIVALLG